jgi:hypothetical protein
LPKFSVAARPHRHSGARHERERIRARMPPLRYRERRDCRGGILPPQTVRKRTHLFPFPSLEGCPEGGVVLRSATTPSGGACITSPPRRRGSNTGSACHPSWEGNFFKRRIAVYIMLIMRFFDVFGRSGPNPRARSCLLQARFVQSRQTANRNFFQKKVTLTGGCDINIFVVEVKKGAKAKYG